MQRAAAAKIAAQLSDVDSFFLLAAPMQPVKLGGLYSSKSAEYKAISEPPVYRQFGFDLDPHTPVQYVRGELIRRVTGRKGLELWQDGTLIFVGRNDESFLGWAVRRGSEERNLYINNYVMTEVVSLFLVLTIQIFSNTQEPPENVRVCFGLMAENTEDATYELSSHPVSQQFGCLQGQKVPAENKTFWIDFELRDAIPEVEALKLLKEIYHWFGFTDEQIPYVDSGLDPERVDRARYA